MKKLAIIISMLLLCGIPLYSNVSSNSADEGASFPPIGKSDPVEVVTAQIFNSNGTLVYQGMAYIISGNLVVNTSGWAKGVYTAYAKASGVADRIFTIVCQ
mgnify:FL=1